MTVDDNVLLFFFLVPPPAVTVEVHMTSMGRSAIGSADEKQKRENRKSRQNTIQGDVPTPFFEAKTMLPF